MKTRRVADFYAGEKRGNTQNDFSFKGVGKGGCVCVWGGYKKIEIKSENGKLIVTARRKD